MSEGVLRWRPIPEYPLILTAITTGRYSGERVPVMQADGRVIAIHRLVKGQTTPAFGPENELPVYSDQEHRSLRSCKTTAVPSRQLLGQAHDQKVLAFCIQAISNRPHFAQICINFAVPFPIA